MKFSVLTALAIGFLGGTVVSMVMIPSDIINHGVIIGICCILVTLIITRSTNDHRTGIILLCIILGMSIGVYRVNRIHEHYPFDSFNQYHNQTVSIIGTVVRAPEKKPEKQLIRINPEYVNGEKRNHSLDVVIHGDGASRFRHGDHVVITGKFTLRSDFISDTQRTVPYRLMGYSKGIAGDIRYPESYEIQKTQETVLGFFDSIKQRFLRSLESVFMPPASGLLAGMMIGDTSSLNDDMLDVFRMVGLIHIVVLSGYNITLIANAFVRIFAFRGYHQRLLLAMIALIIFIGVVGISQTALRAGIMALCVFLSRYLIRPHVITRALLYALCSMIWISPYALLFDLSLQLSFLATVGIVYVFPVLQKQYSSLAEKMWGEILLQTIAVNSVVLPIILYQIGTISPVLLPLNIIVLGFIPLLTIGGFMITLIGMLFPQVAGILGIPIQYITEQIITLATWTAKNDPLYTTVQPFPFWVIISFYVIMFGVIIQYYRKNRIDETSRLII